MVNNIKTEIIYYCGPTDFEFEFNLCGSCQMRLLTSTANDKPSLLKVLQRGITRSRVIIIVGNLNGEDGIINSVSKSIGYSCEKIDTTIYDIKSTDDLLIIKNSVPLITDNGKFGGCIIESGPQSMIFLTDDKKIRKEIMNSLVHGYIKDLSEYPLVALPQQEQLPVDSIQSEVIENDNSALDTLDTVMENPIITEQEAEHIDDNDSIKQETDPFNINNLLTDNSIHEIDSISDKKIVYEDDFYDAAAARHKRSDKALDVFTLILSAILLLTLAFVCYSYIYLPLKNGISIVDNFKDIFSFIFN